MNTRGRPVNPYAIARTGRKLNLLLEKVDVDKLRALSIERKVSMAEIVRIWIRES